MQLKLFKLQTSYQLIEKQKVFQSSQNLTRSIQQIKVYYENQPIKLSFIQESKGQGMADFISIGIK